MSRSYYCKDKRKLSYDYEKQVWIVNGRYQNCGHPASMACGCYGRAHANQPAVITPACE